VTNSANVAESLSTAGEDETVAPLFEPLHFPGCSLPNRFVMAPMTRRRSPNGIPGQNVVDYYARRAKSGVGLIITEGTYIDHPSAGSTAGVPHFFGKDAAAGWARVAEAVHRYGGRIFPQLWHLGGEHQPPDPDSASGHVLSPSGLALTGTPHGRAMTVGDIDAVIASYVRGARLAKQLGFDGVEIHAAHGYLIDQFLWAFTNHRTDAYGGDAGTRTRFAVEVVAAIRAEVGGDYPISFRFSQWKVADYDARIATRASELAELLGPISDAGVSIFHASARRFQAHAFNDSALTLAGWTRKITGKPVITVGSVGLEGEFTPGANAPRAATTDLSQLVEKFNAGEFDLVAIGRALLANHDWVELVKNGKQPQLRAYSRDLGTELY
jgi:2,4-dienoyl-CoA reductase-like NADH-dependent reductase (Old Yellow Enzyme family)